MRLLLRQLGLPFERVAVDIFGGDTLADTYVRINPLRTTPVLETDDGRFLTESAAILWHLAEGTPLLPRDPVERAQVLGWLVYEQTDVIPPIGGLRFRLQTGRIQPEEPDALARREAGLEVLVYVNDHLDGRAFFVGDAYSIADVALYGYVHVAHEAGYPMDDYPHVVAWLARVAEQPAYLDDLEPYPPNARPGVGRSTYE